MSKALELIVIDKIKIVVCITFHYVEARLQYLQQVIEGLQEFPCQLNVCVCTNTTQREEQQAILAAMQSQRNPHYMLCIVDNLFHPFMLTWAHKSLLKQYYDLETESPFTHFVYLEDDLAFTPVNMQFWLENRQRMKETPFYPSLLRVEWNKDKQLWHSSESEGPISISRLPRITLDGYDFINLPNPYQGLTVYDRELLAEHMQSISFNANQYCGLQILDSCNQSGGNWPCRERANYGQQFINVPIGFFSRNLVMCSIKFRETDSRSWVHHLPNNYVTFPGSTPMKELFCE